MEKSNGRFEFFCRRRGTRCNAIMTMVERGADDETIARRFDTDIPTIRVYRKAYNDELTEPSEAVPADAIEQLRRAKELIAEIFDGASALPDKMERFDLDVERFEALMKEKAGTKSLYAADRKLFGKGQAFAEIRREKSITALRIAQIADKCGFNLYEMGIAKRRKRRNKKCK